MKRQRVRGNIPVKGGGVCIYCDSDGDGRRLGDEHILPYSLGGTAQLVEASCARCEGITSYLDGYLANSIFRDLRAHLDIQSRSGHPEMLKTAIDQDGVWRELQVPKADHPFVLAMPVWAMPGILCGAPMPTGWGQVYVHGYILEPPTAAEAMGLQPGETLQLRYSRRAPNPVPFARALAKIAYCDGIRMYGLGGFRPLATRDIILGKYPVIPHFIGTDSIETPPPPNPPGEQHQVTQAVYSVGRHKLLIATIRLFADSGQGNKGMPIYHVVYGAQGSRVITPRRPAPALPRSIAL